MIRHLNKIPMLTFFLFLSQQVYADSGVPMADLMRSSGKIYVVVVSLLLILVGLFIYLFVTERKIKKLEDKMRDRR